MPRLRKRADKRRVSRRPQILARWRKRVSVFLWPPRRKVLRSKARRKRSGATVVQRAEPISPTVTERPVEATHKEILYSQFVPMIASKVKKGFLYPARAKYFPPNPGTLIAGDIRVKVEFHQSMPIDMDNALKPIIDLLKGSVIVDDRQIKGIHSMYIHNSPLLGYYIEIGRYYPPKDYFY